MDQAGADRNVSPAASLEPLACPIAPLLVDGLNFEIGTAALHAWCNSEFQMNGTRLFVLLGAFCWCAAPSVVRAQGTPPDSPQARRIAALVEKAAALVDRKGKAAFTEFRKPGSEWFQGNTYLFAYDFKGNVLFNPAFPAREGTNVSGQKDASGKAFHDEMIRTAQTRGSGWVDYAFPRPGQALPSRKWSYVKRIQVDGVPGLIAAGFYPD